MNKSATTTNFGTSLPVPGSADPLARATEEAPDVTDINTMQLEYQAAWSQDGDSYLRLARAEDIRYTRWPGQTDDGLKHQEVLPEGERAMPYDRAPDCRVPLADSVIQSQVDVEYLAFWNARTKTAPTSASRLTAGQAAEWRALMSWMIHGPLRARLVDDVEFVSQVMNTCGWCVLHPIWRKTEQNRLKRLSMDEIAGMADQAPQGSFAQQVPGLIMDPTSEDDATKLLQVFFPNLKARRARRVVQELREQGEAEFPVPQVVSNAPELAVLVPYQDVVMPMEAMANPDHARWIARRMFFSEAGLRDRAREEGWGEDFVEESLKTKGLSMENGSSEEHASDVNRQLIEIIYFYQKGVDDDDVPAIYCTVFSPHVRASNGEQALYGTKWLVDYAHGKLPFIFVSTEVTGRRPADARGVPEQLVTSQLEMKQQRDATYVYSQMSITPPLQKRGTQASKLPPELGPMGVINNISGEWEWFAPPNGKPEIAFKLIEDVRKEAEDYYGVARADTPPMRWQPRQQRRAMRWLSKWGEAFWQLSVLAYQHLEPDELQSIIGRQPTLTADLVARHQLLFWFDVRTMDPDWVESLLQSISQFVLPSDAGGVVDRSKLVQFALAYLDPTLAEEVTMDQEGAKQAVFKGVRDEIGSIMQGNEGLYSENDPTAKTKLLFAQQIIASNPDYQLQLNEKSPMFNPRKYQLLEKWTKNLTQSAMQQDNKVIGRLGVMPGAGMGAMQQG